MSEKLPCREDSHCIAVSSGEVEIMQCNKHGASSPAHQLEQLQLMSDIEMICRLIQDQYRRVLSQCASEKDALLLTSRELRERSSAEVKRAYLIQCVTRHVHVRIGITAEALAMRNAAKEHQVQNRNIKLFMMFLRHHCDPLGDLPAR